VLDDVDELDVVDGSLIVDVVVAAVVVVVHTAIVLNAESGTIAHWFCTSHHSCTHAPPPFS
jgi:hypothetical protein